MSGFSPKQMEIFKFMYEPEYVALICDGAVRSGKTTCMSFGFLTWAFKSFNEMNFALCGKQCVQLKEIFCARSWV